MVEIPTVLVKNVDASNGSEPYRINEVDFDPEKHKKVIATRARVTKKKRRETNGNGE